MTPTDWAIRGMGAIAGVGGDVDEIFEALCAGRTARGRLRGFDPDKFRAQHAYEIDDRPGDGSDRPGRATAWLVEAIAQALRDAGLPEQLGDTPVLIGTGLRELRSAELWWAGGVELTEAQLHFGTALRARFGACATYTFCNACSASLYALALGSDLLELGGADTVVVAGVDSITASMFGLLDRVHPAPVDAVRPFDRERRGVLMGEGAAAVVLSRMDGKSPDREPPDRESRVWARLRGVAVNCDAYHPTAPDVRGIVAAIRDAQRRADVDAAQVDLLLAHGTGTLRNDETEAGALREVFEGRPGPLITAIKSMTGHTSGGSGLLSLVIAVRAMACGRIPPTVGLHDPVEEAASLRFVRGTQEYASPRLSQVEAFGFGGVNAVAMVQKQG
jgi:3-oxoacyl-[acyl-carrier-protein] synthase II